MHIPNKYQSVSIYNHLQLQSLSKIETTTGRNWPIGKSLKMQRQQSAEVVGCINKNKHMAVEMPTK